MAKPRAASALLQLNFFEKPKLVSRWKGDGPFPWTDSGCWAPRDPNARWFDGVGWCQAEVRWCDRCGVWHPTNNGEVWEQRHSVSAPTIETRADG